MPLCSVYQLCSRLIGTTVQSILKGPGDVVVLSQQSLVLNMPIKIVLYHPSVTH